MVKEAVLHTTQSNYSHPINMNTLFLRLRTKKDDIQNCYVFYGDRCCSEEPILCNSAKMELRESDDLFDYYEVELSPGFKRICYYFMLDDGSRNYFYYGDRFYDEIEKLNNRVKYYQYPYIREKDIVKVPDWAKDAIIYHIFPDSFASGEKEITEESFLLEDSNGVKSHSQLGGTINGIIKNIPYLTELGVNCLYLNPIFKSVSYHKYDTTDYYEIDPCLGTKEDFKTLVEKCHQNSIKIILDGVFNHSGIHFFAFEDLIRNGEKSIYKDWYLPHSFPVKPVYPPNYEAFAYVENMPRLNTANTEVIEYFIKVGKYWIEEFDIDGWRLDVANEIDHHFWREFRKAIKSVKEDAFLIAEIWEEAQSFLGGDQFDSAMDYEFTELCEKFFAKECIAPTQFDQQLSRLRVRYKQQIQKCLMTFLDTHDVKRFVTDCFHNEDALKLASMFLLTYEGVPSVFYGDEVGISGTRECEYRKAMLWKEANDNNELFCHYKKLIGLRNKNIALRRGSFKREFIDDLNGIYGFTRSHQNQKMMILLNNSSFTRKIELKIETSQNELLDVYNGVVIIKGKNGEFIIELKPYGGSIMEI